MFDNRGLAVLAAISLGVVVEQGPEVVRLPNFSVDLRLDVITFI
jgi:hypothetical protein